MSKDTKLFIRGKTINFEEKLLDINNISFYSNNPRIASIVSTIPKDELTDDLIDEKLWNSNNTHKLKRQIEADGGLIHSIIVFDGKVLEGNTRLCCYRHLFEETGDDRWKLIRVQVILDELSQDDIYRLLCSEHIDGKIEWDPFEKGNLFHKMHKEELKSFEDIATLTKESCNSIRQMIKAYELMIENGETNKKRFSHFLELVKSDGIRKHKNKDPEVVSKVVGLIKDGVFKDAKDLRKVSEILEDKKSKKKLFDEKEDINKVYGDLKRKNPLIGTTFYSDVNNIYNKLLKMTRNDREKLKNNGKICQRLKKLTKEFIKLCGELDIPLNYYTK